MDKQTHTPGPFSVNPTGDMGEHFFGSDEHGALGTFDEPFGKGSAAGNARRAVAAWNAVEGIPTEALEDGYVGDLKRMFQYLVDSLNAGYFVLLGPTEECEAFLHAAEGTLARLRGETDA